MTRKKRNKHRPYFVFTIETINLMQKALDLFEQPLQRADHQDPKVAFAEETMQRVKVKLASMKQSAVQLRVTTFDYNEKIIITGALRLYSLTLLTLPADNRRARELRQCQRIATHFAVTHPKRP